MTADLVKVLLPMATSFFLGVALTPLLTHYLYKFKAWKKVAGKTALDGTPAAEHAKLRSEVETKTPRMGGVIIWMSVLITTLLYWGLAQISSDTFFSSIDFLSRDQTWIPLCALILGGLVGLLNDFFDLSPIGERGISLKGRLLIVSAAALFVGWWFYEKLEVTTLGMPFMADITLGWLIIPLFLLVMLGIYASGVIDGIDGLAGGVFASVFAAYAIIAFMQEQYNLAAFSGALVGAMLAFLWFNIPPARFWMTETGTMGITLTIGILAFMTDSLGGGEGIMLLPIIGFLLVVTVLSNIVQVASKKILGRKVFLVAPLHHHFEAKGWPHYKITMRYWVLSIILAFSGVLIAIIG